MGKLEKIVKFCENCQKKRIYVLLGRDDKYKYYGCKTCGKMVDVEAEIKYDLNSIFLKEQNGGIEQEKNN